MNLFSSLSRIHPSCSTENSRNIQLPAVHLLISFSIAKFFKDAIQLIYLHVCYGPKQWPYTDLI